MMKKFSVGMYGGKFLPFHLGHNYCIRVAAEECETVYAILFWGGFDEERICRDMRCEWLTHTERMNSLRSSAGKFTNVIACEIDISALRLTDGHMDDMKRSFRSLSVFEYVMIIIMVAIAAQAVVTAFTSPETSKNPAWLTVINFVSAVCGILCVFLTAKTRL